MRGLRALIQVLEENPNHVPAGSPAGGQFAKGGGGGDELANLSSADSIAKSFAYAAKYTADRTAYFQKLTSQLPEGTNIAGWTKQTLVGDVFWNKGKRWETHLLREVGLPKLQAALKKFDITIKDEYKYDES